MTTNLTGLRTAEAFIDRIGAVENFKCFSEGSDPSVSFLDPRMYINLGIGVSAYACIDAATRVATVIPTIGYDIGYGMTHRSSEHLKDAVITIPKGVMHIVADAGIVTGVTVGGIAVVAGGILAGAYIGTRFVLGLACSLTEKTISKIYNA